MAPPLLRGEALAPDLREQVRRGLGVAAEDVVDARWADNGTGWLALRLRDRAAVLAIDQPPYRAFLGAPVISAASLAAVEGGRCSLSLAYRRRPAAN